MQKDKRYPRWKAWLFAGLGAVALLAPRPAMGQGRVAGRVTDALTGSAIAVAEIRVQETSFFALSASDGSFLIEGLPAGAYTLVATSVGYRPLKRAIEVDDGGSTTMSFTLDPAPIAIEELVVTPGHFGVAQQEVRPSRQTLTQKDLEERPQLGEDIFRTVDRLPGIASTDVSTALWIRGGFPNETLIRFDGLELYEPYHLKDFDGALSIIDVEAVGGVDLTTSGFTTEFGDKLTAVFDMQSIAPPQQMQTSVGLSFTNLRAMSKGTFNSGKGLWVFSARRGYLDIVLGLTGGNEDLSPTYFDLLGVLGYQLGRDHALTARFLYAGDELTFIEEPNELRSAWSSGYAWLDWDARLGSNLSTNTLASAGRVTRDRRGFGLDFDGAVELDVLDELDFDFFGLMQNWELLVSERDLVRFGFDYRRQVARYDYFAFTRDFEVEGDSVVEVLDTVDIVTDPAGNEWGLYATNRFRISEPLTVEVGLRYDRQTWSGDDDLTPRINFALALGRNTGLRGVWGRYYQAQGIQELNVGDGESTFQNRELATQLALGLDHTLENGLIARLEGYWRDVDNPRTYYYNLDRNIEAFPALENDRVKIDPTSAEATGVELLLSRDRGGRFAWSGSYVLSKATDEVDGVDVPRPLDQTHTVTVNLAYRPSPRWHLGLAWQYHTGWPITPATFTLDTLSNGDLSLDKSWGELNSERLPAYVRLDVRATHNFRVGRNRLALYLDVFNVFNRENVRGYEYNVRLVNGRLQTTPIPDTMLPILPTLGVRFDF